MLTGDIISLSGLAVSLIPMLYQGYGFVTQKLEERSFGRFQQQIFGSEMMKEADKEMKALENYLRSGSIIASAILDRLIARFCAFLIAALLSVSAIAIDLPNFESTAIETTNPSDQEFVSTLMGHLGQGTDLERADFIFLVMFAVSLAFTFAVRATIGKQEKRFLAAYGAVKEKLYMSCTYPFLEKYARVVETDLAELFDNPLFVKRYRDAMEKDIDALRKLIRDRDP